MVLKTDKLSLKLSGEENPLFENVSFTLNKGEIGGISGSAGSGKTMLGLTICGYLPLWISRWELHGAIELLGKPVEQGTFCTEAGIILENPYTQLSGMKRSVRQELAFPLECRGIEPETMEPLIERLSHEFGFAHLLERSVRTLSGGELQRLLIACALIARPRFLFLDRPLTEIDTGFREQLLTTITTHLRENEGAALIAEDPWLLPEQPNIPTAKHLGQAEEKQEITPQEAPSQTKSVQSEADDRHRLSVENLTFAYTPSSPVINNLSFSLSAGELAFVTGPNGAGKTTLAKLITGILKPLSGHILIDNQPIVKKELWEIASLVGLAFQNPGLHLSRRTVREELELAAASFPITTYVYGGVTLAGSDFITTVFKSIGMSLEKSVLLGSLFTDSFDKLATALICFALVRSLPPRMLERFSRK